MNNMNKTLTLTLIAGLVSSLSPALADQFVVRETVVSPQMVVVPAQTILAPAVFVPATAELTPDSITTTRRTTVIEAPVNNATSSHTTAFSADLGPLPIYSNRLAAMNDQINNASTKGWMTQAQANSLLLEHDRLASMISSRSTTRFDSDSLEKGLNSLNLAIQAAMNYTHTTAGLRQGQ